MIIKSVELNNFRNYDSLSINFGKDNNILYGDNAQGKTNVLESIYVCATTKSHKGSKDREIIKIGEEEAHIKMLVEKNDIEHKIDMHLKKNKTKGVAIDGIPAKKSSEVFGLINVVFFSPEDLSIIKSGPSERRKFIDMQLCQLDKIYLYNLMNYNKIIIQRNNLLKQIGCNNRLLDTLSIWDDQLINYGSLIIKRRKEFIRELSDIVKDIHYKISGNLENIDIDYDCNVKEEDFERQLKISQEKDLILKSTSVGPHRDDMCISLKGNDLRKYGSQGQQRTCALSLKLSEIELVRNNIKDNPILLLDDVLSELDRKRQNYLLNSISNTQTIITCTGLEEFVGNRFNIDKVFHVVNGKISQGNNVIEL